MSRGTGTRNVALTFLNFGKSKRKKMSKLTEQERQTILPNLQGAGWTLVDGRDAIYKVMFVCLCLSVCCLYLSLVPFSLSVSLSVCIQRSSLSVSLSLTNTRSQFR